MPSQKIVLEIPFRYSEIQKAYRGASRAGCSTWILKWEDVTFVCSTEHQKSAKSWHKMSGLGSIRFFLISTVCSLKCLWTQLDRPSTRAAIFFFSESIVENAKNQSLIINEIQNILKFFSLSRLYFFLILSITLSFLIQ